MRKIAAIFLTFITVLALAVPAFAAQTGEALIEVVVDDAIDLTSSDTFIITYGPEGSEETKTLEIAAKDIAGEVGSFQLPEGVYIVYGCQYNGDNVDIIEQGYAVTSVFEVGDLGVNQIKLAIGFNTGMRLIDEEADYMAYQNGEVVETLDPQPVNDDPDLYNGDGTGVKKVRPKSETVTDDTDTYSEDAEDYDDNEIVEREKKNKPSTGIWIKLVLLGVVGLTGVITLVVLKKKNKL